MRPEAVEPKLPPRRLDVAALRRAMLYSNNLLDQPAAATMQSRNYAEKLLEKLGRIDPFG